MIEVADVLPFANFAVTAAFGAVTAAFGAVVGFIAGRSSTRAAKGDAELLAFVEQAAFSLQCLPGINGDDPQWAVTNGTKVVGVPSFELRDAIRSSIGDVYLLDHLSPEQKNG